tara:strand:- start:1515 stop:1736 length:222 start_codon:yes stop_codon:yes gene_type:complete
MADKGYKIGLKGLFSLVKKGYGGGDSSSDSKSAGKGGSAPKARISRVKGGGGKKSPATKRGYKAPPSRPGRRP